MIQITTKLNENVYINEHYY